MWAPPTPARAYKHWHITLCVFVPLLYEPVQPMQRVSHLDPGLGCDTHGAKFIDATALTRIMDTAEAALIVQGRFFIESSTKPTGRISFLCGCIYVPCGAVT